MLKELLARRNVFSYKSILIFYCQITQSAKDQQSTILDYPDNCFYGGFFRTLNSILPNLWIIHLAARKQEKNGIGRSGSKLK